MKRVLAFCLVLVMVALAALPVHPTSAQGTVELVMGSWRTEDIKQWDQILAAFNKQYPNIKVTFQPTLNTEYNTALQAALAAGTGPDLITCRPFDLTLGLFNKGYLTDVTNLAGMEHFNAVARSGWTTDDGKTTYCVPMASVIHGFIYNADMFEKNGWKPPKTMEEFHTLLKAIKDAGVTPLAMGTKDGWTNMTMGFDNIGPNYWDGETGRQALIAGTAKLTEKPFIDVFKELASWKDYLPAGFEAVGYADTQQLFPQGKAAIFPAGSWEIPIFSENAKFKMSAFKPPVVDANAKTCWINDHIDIAVGGNKASKHPKEVETFLQWMTTQEFAEMYTNLQPGFFSLSDYKLTLKDPLAAQFISWRQECKGTIRVLDQFLSRGEVSAGQETWVIMPAMVSGQMTPEQAAEKLQALLWYPKK
ncbi:MAG: extracellular solute-binding protein [Anaerolineae bacterium]|nr:extracellular solute-binding protein [Anaerolineae bacterium]